jgi:Protein of unknown function (DUF3987)
MDETGRGGSWLHDYLRHTEQMESPSSFHRWVALGIVGHILGRRVWLSKRGNYAVFPGQMMVCLVSPSAVLRKSTAVAVGAKLLAAVEQRTAGQGIVNRIADRGSPQSFLEQMRPCDGAGVPIEDADCTAMIVASELGAFLSNESWMEQMPTLVVALNDAPTGEFNEETLSFEPYTWRSRFVTKVPFELRNPCIGMVAATTPTGLAKEIPKQAQLAGFFGRVIWVYAETTDKPRDAMLDPRPHVSGLSGRLIEGLLRMTRLAGPVTLQTDAREWARAWYEEGNGAQPEPKDAGLASGFHSRRQDHILRVAIVLAAMDGSVGKKSGRLAVQLPHMREATRYIEEIERALPRCFLEVTARGRAALETKILQLARRHAPEWVSRQKIIRKMWYWGFHTREVDEATKQLVAVRYLRQRGVGGQATFLFKESRGAMLRLVKEATRERDETEEGEEAPVDREVEDG